VCGPELSALSRFVFFAMGFSGFFPVLHLFTLTGGFWIFGVENFFVYFKIKGSKAYPEAV
jgi:hypothetical protein